MKKVTVFVSSHFKQCLANNQCQDKESSKLIQLLQPCASQHSEFFSMAHP